MSVPDFDNPTRWFYAFESEAEYWFHGGETRQECIAAAAQGDDPVWIVEARRMVPNFDIFDAEELMEQISDQDCWAEDGPEGMPPFERGDREFTDLQAELSAVLRRWFTTHGDLHGAQLDFVQGPDRIDPVRAA